MKTRRYRTTPVFTHIEDVLAWLSHSPDPLVQRRVQRRHPQRLTHTILTGDSDQQIQMTRRHRDEPCDRRATSESPRSPHCGPPGRSPPSSASSNSASRRCASAAGSYRSSSCDCFAKSRTDHRHRNGVSAASQTHFGDGVKPKWVAKRNRRPRQPPTTDSYARERFPC